MRLLRPIPIDEAAYRPFGSVVRAGPDPLARVANHGTARAWDGLATIESTRDASARCTASLFRCLAYRGERLPVLRLERHPCSTQMFAPMRAARYLVIVAHGADAPALETLAAFLIEGPCAITYAPGVWHHPMVALDADADFVNVVFSDGTERDCEERAVEPGVVSIELGSP